MNDFVANVQYNDYRGSAAADRSDTEAFEEYLRGVGLSQEGEYLEAVRVTIGENHGMEVNRFGVTAYLSAAGEVGDPRALRVVEVDISVQLYLKFFKRFVVVLTRDGADLREAKLEWPALE